MQIRIASFDALVFGALMLQWGLNAPAHATLKFYYNPATGNVSFDTAGTRSGAVNSYFFEINYASPTWFFRPENQIRLSSGALYIATSTFLSDATLGTSWQGLYSIGDVFPAGLSEEVWTSFVQSNYQAGQLNYGYNDVIGGGQASAAEFIFGQPDGEFVNKWDLVDPNTLTWATTARLTYRPWNGEVLIDTTSETSGYISGFSIASDGQILADRFNPFVNGPLVGASEDGTFTFADAIEPGVYSIGQILPSGLSAEGFESAITDAKFLGRAGFKGGSFDLEADGISMSLHFVPEPNSALLMIAGIFGVFWSLHRHGHGADNDF